MNKILLFFITILFSLNAYAVTNVTFWHMEGVPHRVDRIQTLIDEFNSANPDINVTQEVQNWGEIYAKAPASVAAGTAPEILVGIPDFTPILADMGAAQPVEDFVAELDSKYGFYQKHSINILIMVILGLFLYGTWVYHYGIEKVILKLLELSHQKLGLI